MAGYREKLTSNLMSDGSLATPLALMTDRFNS
jgi:hypothetical protein